MPLIKVPKLIDCHVHFREPGLTHKGDMETESTAAAHGGVRVACDMPNTSPPTQTIQALSDKVKASERCRHLCDLRFFFGATHPSHLCELETLWTNPIHSDLKARCCGLKLYLDNSTGDLRSDEGVTRTAFELCGRLGITLVAHCEDATTNARCCDHIPYTSPSTHSDRRPAASEETSIVWAISVAKEYGTKLHIAHLSTAGGLEAVRKAKAEGLPVTCEVTPHHLFLTTDDYATVGTSVKVNPPIRNLANRDALWHGLQSGVVDCIATDHAPHTVEEKANVSNPPSGIPGVELVVPLMLTGMAGIWPHPTTAAPNGWPFHVTSEDLVKWMHTNPNRIFNLGISEDAVTTLDTSLQWRVSGDNLHSKVRWTPYEGWKLQGVALFDS